MIPLDYHLHSRFSVDGHYSIDEMCDAALARGLREICLTEHIDFDREDAGYGFFDYGAYSAAVDEARAKYAGRLVIRKGLEFDFRRAFGAEPGEVLATMAFDFLIGSVHTAAGQRLYRLPDAVPPGLVVRDLLADYFAEVEALVVSGWCHVVGHFDYVYKQLPAMVEPLRDGWYWRHVERILALCLSRHVAIEVNTHHMLDRRLGMAADVEILRRYRSLGGRVVTVGSDAHCPGDVAHAFAEAGAALRQAGFTTICGFEGGRPYEVPLPA